MKENDKKNVALFLIFIFNHKMKSVLFPSNFQEIWLKCKLARPIEVLLSDSASYSYVVNGMKKKRF